MAALGTVAKNQIKRGLMRHWSDEREETAFNKAALTTAVTDADDWLDANELAVSNNTGYTAALTGGFSANATGLQKQVLRLFVAARRRSKAWLEELYPNVD